MCRPGFDPIFNPRFQIHRVDVMEEGRRWLCGHMDTWGQLKAAKKNKKMQRRINDWIAFVEQIDSTSNTKTMIEFHWNLLLLWLVKII